MRNLMFFALLVVARLASAGQEVVPAATPTIAGEPVEIVLFSDFQCPFCAQFAAPFRELEAKGVDGVKTRVVFKNFPLSIHPNSQLAHQAALSAGNQGKFWEMHDLLFANQQRVQRSDLMGYAAKLGLDVARFEKDMDGEGVKAIIRADLAEGEKRQVSGTPTFFINGKPYSGTRTVAQLKQLVEGDQRRVRALAEVTDGMMSRGPADAPITIEFFADLQSPVSGPALRVIEQVMRERSTSVRLQFRNFPLAFHPQAPLAHEAAMVAAREGKFWDFAAFILQHQDSLREQELLALAASLGLDQQRFASVLHEHRYAARIDADVAAGLNRGIRGSPVVVVNGKRIDGVPSLEMLTAYVDAAVISHSSSSKQD